MFENDGSGLQPSPIFGDSHLGLPAVGPGCYVGAPSALRSVVPFIWGVRCGCAMGALCADWECLNVLISQDGTRRIARVYMDLDGFALVGIGPSLGIFLFRKIATVVAHLIFEILVDIG